jgi:predicted nucleotidyltransferase
MRTSGIESFQPPSIDAPVLAEIVRHLAEAYRPEKIYLFGSRARGMLGPTVITI